MITENLTKWLIAKYPLKILNTVITSVYVLANGMASLHVKTFANTVHYNDVIMSAMASQITSVSNVCSIIWSGADQRKRQCSGSLAFFVRGIYRWSVDSPHKGPVTWEMSPFDNSSWWSSSCPCWNGIQIWMVKHSIAGPYIDGLVKTAVTPVR